MQRVAGGAAALTPAIVPVATDRQIERFVDLPYRLYAGDPVWVPPLRRDERRRFDPQHNPFLAHADIELWIALDGQRVTGRIAGIDERLYYQAQESGAVWFGILAQQ